MLCVYSLGAYMENCEICGRDFKNLSGLSGHKQLAHALDSGATEARKTASERQEERLVELLEPLLEQQDKRFVERLEQQEKRFSAQLQISERAEDVDQTCPAGHQFIDIEWICKECAQTEFTAIEAQALQDGEDRAREYYESIPGIVGFVKKYEESKAVVAKEQELRNSTIRITR